MPELVADVGLVVADDGLEAHVQAKPPEGFGDAQGIAVGSPPHQQFRANGNRFNDEDSVSGRAPRHDGSLAISSGQSRAGSSLRRRWQETRSRWSWQPD